MTLKTKQYFSRPFSEEVKRAFSSRGMIISLFISILILSLGAYLTRNYPVEISFVDQWYFIYQESFFVQILPLIVTLPFTDSLSSDRKLGYLDRALHKASAFQADMRGFTLKTRALREPRRPLIPKITLLDHML